MTAKYADECYRILRDGARKSALPTRPFLVRCVRPRSIIDVRCGPVFSMTGDPRKLIVILEREP